MIDHTGVQVSDPARSRRFYEAALAPLGYAVLREVPPEFTGGAVVLGYGVRPIPDFWMIGGTPNEPRVHVAFRADSRQQVDAFYRAALAAGGKDNGSARAAPALPPGLLRGVHPRSGRPQHRGRLPRPGLACPDAPPRGYRRQAAARLPPALGYWQHSAPRPAP